MEDTGNKNLLNTLLETISGIFSPMLGVMCGAGMLKALLILCTTLNILTADMGTYKILYAAADSVFNFMPIILGYTAAKKFKCNPFIAMSIAMSLLYPTMTAAYSEGNEIDIPYNTSDSCKLCFFCHANHYFCICSKQIRKAIKEDYSRSM